MPPQGYQPLQAPVSATPKGSGLGKVLLWLGGIFLLLFMIVAGAAIYGAYWVKHKVSNYASAISGGSRDNLKVVASGGRWRMLSTADLQKRLGGEVEEG